MANRSLAGARRRTRRTFVAVAVVSAFALAPTPMTRASTSSSSAGTGIVRGNVTDGATHRAVSGAAVGIASLGLRGQTGSDGSFAIGGVPTVAPYRRLDITVTAAGHADWRIIGVPLSPGDGLILNVVLGSRPFTDRVLTPQERAKLGPSAGPATDRPTSGTCSNWNYQQVPPPTIWVLRLDTGISEQYDFEFYASHVLPNEWISSWDQDALAAGAIAVRTYAAWHELSGNSYSSGSNCADVRDTIDGVFDPSWTTAQAELAVQAAFGSIVYQNTGLFVAHYYAGTETCAPSPPPYTGWMSQWGTQACADPKQGDMVYPDIVDVFYEISGYSTAWYYTYDLLLNPNVNSEGMYPWVPNGSTTIARTKGTGDGDKWFLHVTPTQSGKNGIVYQERPYDATASTTYHAAISLRCADGGASSCSVTIKVVSIPDKGSATYRSLAVSVPNDGAWHPYAFDPATSGIVHSSVKLSLVSKQQFDADSAVLTSPYGGQ